MPFRNTFKKSRTRTIEARSLKSGTRHTIFAVNGDEYTGEWLDNKRHGLGNQVWKKSGATYNGEWKFGKCDGHGTFSIRHPETKDYILKYCGGWENGKKHGYGTYYYSQSAVYEGEWSEDNRSGQGVMYYDNGDIYEGEWLLDKRDGEGFIQLSNGNWYKGEWKDGRKNGNGKFFYSDKGQMYEGLWVNGVAKCGTLSNYGRGAVPTPKKYEFPQIQLEDTDQVLKEAKSIFCGDDL